MGRAERRVWNLGLSFVLGLSVSVSGCTEDPLLPCTGSSCGSAGDGDFSSGGGSNKAKLPCDVKAIVYEHCTSCHDDPPVSTYMPLLTQAHFHEKSFTEPKLTNYELAAKRILDEDDPMPPRGEDPLTDEQKDILSAWFDDGAPAYSGSCGNEGDGDGDGDASGDGDGDDTGDGDGDGGDGDIVIEEDDGTPVELECHKFLAHANNDKSKKYKVGQAADRYIYAVFESPWKQTVYGVLFRPVKDNTKVLHHWLLYRDPANAAQDGNVDITYGQHTVAELVHGWAPGGQDLDFREHGHNIGMELPPGKYGMEFHYNSADGNAEDASGVEVCVRTSKPKNVAGLSWLGLDHGLESYFIGGVFSPEASGNCAFPSDEWVGTCNPAGGDKPIHLLFVFPHMHEKGLHMKGVINGKSGAKRTLHDKDFNFDSQVIYKVDDVLMPGESITTTCNYSQPMCSGQKTTAEMCYLYTYAYPKGALVDAGGWGRLAHGDNVCLGQ